MACVASHKLRGTLPFLLSAYPLPLVGGVFSFSFFFMPYNPDARLAAIARYGFASDPTTLVSRRVELLLPVKTLNAVVRLSTAHVNVVGAQAPSTSRLSLLIAGG